MQIKTALLSLPFLAVIAFVAPSSRGAPPVQTAAPAPPPVQKAPTPIQQAPPKVKQFVKLAVKNAAAVAGEKRTLEATLTAGTGDNGVGGKTVIFRVEGKNGSSVPGGSIEACTDVTNAAGKASCVFTVPELLPAAYALKASFAGDEQTRAASDEGNFGTLKGLTKIELTFIPTPHLNGATVQFKLLRSSDGKLLTRENLPCTINGNTCRWGYTETNGPYTDKLMLRNATSWTVTAQFAGDAKYQASSTQGSYTMP